MKLAWNVILIGLLCLTSLPGKWQAESDAPASVGAMLPHLVGTERQLFRSGRDAFSRVTSVQGDVYIPNTEAGLGPRFNGTSCAMCHAYPAPGGSSPSINPQLEIAKQQGARNRLPSFLHPDSPVLQVRFRTDSLGNLDGSVHPLFSIAGRADAQGCGLSQPDFELEQRRGNLSFRIPTPLFGAGLIEAIPDSEIAANDSRALVEKQTLGIHGHPNTLAPAGATGRFGWKAEVSSLESFTAEAYAIEQGVTNELYPQEPSDTPSDCRFNTVPEDRFSPFARRAIDGMSNVNRVAYYLRFLAPPPPPPDTPAITAGRRLFETVGCALCHTPALHTSKSSHAALSEQPVALYSDLLLHHMGADLADHVRQGAAGPDEFRTAPLWGLGKRLFYLHDGRTRDLNQAILAHSSRPYLSTPSESAGVVTRYRALTPENKAALIMFLKNL